MRFKVVEGSESKHCCFDATVVDTTKPWSADRYEPVCECFESEDAKMIADALNASERLAEADAAAKTWENEAERRSRRYEKAAVRLAEAVAALHDIAHAEPEASALRLRFMAADALIRHNTADSADEVQP